MKNPKLLLFGLGLLALFSSGYGRLGQSAGLDHKDEKDLEEMLDFSEKHANEMSKGYEKAPRKPELDISSSPADVHFYLYNNPQDHASFYEIPYGSITEARGAPYKLNAPWKFLIHGFTQSQNSSFPQLLVKEYLKKQQKFPNIEYNIVVVDWGQLAFSASAARLPIYSKAVRNVEIVGKRVGQMITFLKRLELTRDFATGQIRTPIEDLSMVHIIGFRAWPYYESDLNSLGAHVAGKAGDHVNNEFSRKVGRLSGLDPAGPNFYADIPFESGRKLRKGDANAMDIIHTSWGAYGIASEIGDADFFPNAGPLPIQVQPWCIKHHMIANLACSHNLAPVFYALSINHPESMDACQCGSWFSFKTFCPCRFKGNMGEYWQTNEVGRFYLDITSKALDDDMTNLQQQ